MEQNSKNTPAVTLSSFVDVLLIITLRVEKPDLSSSSSVGLFVFQETVWMNSSLIIQNNISHQPHSMLLHRRCFLCLIWPQTKPCEDHRGRRKSRGKGWRRRSGLSSWQRPIKWHQHVQMCQFESSWCLKVKLFCFVFFFFFAVRLIETLTFIPRSSCSYSTSHSCCCHHH